MSDDPFNLRTLPPIEPPEQLWDVLEARLDVRAEHADSAETPERSVAPQQKQWLPMALAAAVSIFAIGLTVLLLQTPEFQPPDAPALADNTIPLQPIASPQADPLKVAQQTSALLETRLSEVSNGVIDAEHLNMLMLLESELGWVDELLVSRPADVELWQQRVSLLDEMNQRYASNDAMPAMQQLVF